MFSYQQQIFISNLRYAYDGHKYIFHIFPFQTLFYEKKRKKIIWDTTKLRYPLKMYIYNMIIKQQGFYSRGQLD